MRIKLTTKEIHEELLMLQSQYPVLTYKSKGYDEIDRSKLTTEEVAADKRINEILGKHITGFNRFQNFNIRKDGAISLRFQYEYEADEPDDGRRKTGFIGVGYLKVDELLTGFDNYEKNNL